jgi:ethanolamine utilization microcompartment shell protein EutL
MINLLFSIVYRHRHFEHARGSDRRLISLGWASTAAQDVFVDMQERQSQGAAEADPGQGEAICVFEINGSQVCRCLDATLEYVTSTFHILTLLSPPSQTKESILYITGDRKSVDFSAKDAKKVMEWNRNVAQKGKTPLIQYRYAPCIEGLGVNAGSRIVTL